MAETHRANRPVTPRAPEARAPAPAVPCDGQWVREAVSRYERPLVLYAERLCREPERARDAVQETFLRLCGQCREEVEPHLAEWLYTVCRRCAVDLHRKETRMAPLTETLADRHVDPSPAPGAALETQEFSGRVARALEALPERQQEILRLKFQHGLSYKEIARVMELSATNVGFLIHTGLKQIRATVAER